MKINPSFSQGFVRSLKWILGLAILSLLLFRQVASTQQPQVTVTPLPDLTIDADRLAASIDFKTQNFRPTDCALAEEDLCVGASGKRSLLRFDVAIPNIGNADFFLGSPTNNALFVYSPCHHHYHLIGFARYELFDTNQAVVLTGRKQAFCLEDFERYSSSAGPAKYTCGFQGITVGWQDVYGKYLDCQWLDVTGIPDGNYFLRVTVNARAKADADSGRRNQIDAHLLESDYSNNTATVPLRIGKGHPR